MGTSYEDVKLGKAYHALKATATVAKKFVLKDNTVAATPNETP